MNAHLDSIVHLSVLCLIALAGFFAIWFRDLLSSVISLSVLSLLLSVEFYILQAPDVAIAEAGIGAGLSMAIYVFALRAIRKTTVRRREEHQ